MFIWPKIKLKSAKLRKIKHGLAENISAPGPMRAAGRKGYSKRGYYLSQIEESRTARIGKP